jgi:hypothetical protein
MTVKIERNKAGLEDLLFGTHTEVQLRAGKKVTVTKINAQNLPFDESRTLAQALNDEKARAFAMFNINDRGELIATFTETGDFSINDNGEFVIGYIGA